jgi:hypothetical protein
MEKHCRESEGLLGGEKPYVPGAAVFEPGRFVVREEVRSALLALEQQAAAAAARFAELVKGEPVPKPKVEPMVPAFGADLSKPRKRPQAKPPAKDKGGRK